VLRRLRALARGAHPRRDERRELAPPENTQRALIIGAGEGGQLIADELRHQLQWRLWPIGYLDDDPDKLGRRINRLPVLGDTTVMPGVVEREGVETVIIAMPSASQADLARVTAIARETDADVLTMPAIGSILRGEEKTTTLRRVRPIDVLGRPMVEPDRTRSRSLIEGRRVLITGAAGSIGQELARQVAGMAPAELILVDINESDLHDRHQELKTQAPDVSIRPIVRSVADEHRMVRLFDATRPEIVFHAAAYKHVPMMERQPDEAVRTNVIGTQILAEQAARIGAERLVIVSTDKAVRPSSVMGASKRLSEVVAFNVGHRTGLSVCAVRFGNVLGSRGSVIPTFERQIREGGPVTVTDPRMRRYFMTIEEASALIIQAGAFDEPNVIFMLDMGDDVSIVELAERVIALHGLRPRVDIPIVYTGIRPGEKLREELSNDFEHARESPHEKIRMLDSRPFVEDRRELDRRIGELYRLAETAPPIDIRDSLHGLVAWVDERERANGALVAARHREALASD
jgi:FlaA1/EpsC-like NDP-sugar epimerase